MTRILITGNMGYIGPVLIRHLRKKYPNAELIGYDVGYFANCLTNAAFFPDIQLSHQIFGDVRNFPPSLLKDIDAVIFLAAISNDPMGKQYEEITMQVNCHSAIKMAEAAKNEGVKSFVFASSCSIYGAADDAPKKENDKLNPLTAYARSKVEAEIGLEKLASESFTVTCFRFGTACGFSERLRLDLVLNDFVASALINKEITILSDGTPWRPLINVQDMARAIEFGINRQKENGGNFLAVNTGSKIWNYQIKDLAEMVAKVIPDTKVNINKDASPDKRSFRVSFDLYEKVAPHHQPLQNLEETVKTLYQNLECLNFSDKNFRNSELIRLRVLRSLQEKKLLNESLIWNWI
ncbi:NAD-dependent epimerase/dehydratase family protein [Cecembia calidifontis]|jgi:nucleoside-diphosphate-sugar epimerase|uniref:Nucleoside-diphosphate-sugar epimerase n=1 Tax=Cecembia calidifontis TaxID=1187080 RepID=A0A4Q7PAI9_9BACT|nr:SDR family oxidoreductase [Cecembia calidifontis]RZS96967.1 nucleoside-diphosphate-sugar epimerase [Cecembia calidifontis]